MKRYLVEAIKEENQTVVDSWDLFTYPTKEEAVEEAKTIAEGGSSINARLMNYTHMLVHELTYDDVDEPTNSEEIASFEVK